MNRISVLVVDDHPLMRTGIVSVLKSYNMYEPVYEADSGDSALSLIFKHIPQVVLMDISLPDKSGLDVIKEVYKTYTSEEIKFLVISVSDFPENYFRAIKVGASGFLSKTLNRDELINGINTIFEGKQYFGSEFTADKIENLVKEFETIHFTQIDPEQVYLSLRETEVLALMYKGYNSKEISEALFLGDTTIKTYRASLMKKFRVSSYPQLNVLINSSERLKRVCTAKILDLGFKNEDEDV